MAGEEKSVPQDEQSSPFHLITLSRSTDCTGHTSRVDSPRAVVPKIKKSAPANDGASTAGDRPVPARRGRRVKNSGRKKTSESAATVEVRNCVDEAHTTAAGKVLDGSDKLTSGDERMRSGKIDVVRSGVVDGTATDKASELTVTGKTECADAASDVERKQLDSDAVAVKDRRCVSVPAGNSRYLPTTSYPRAINIILTLVVSLDFEHLLPHHTTTVLRPFFQDNPGEPVPEDNFWALWYKGRSTEADTSTNRLGATPSVLTSPPSTILLIFFYRPDALLPPNQQRQSTEG